TAVIAAAGSLHHVNRGVSGIPPLAVSGALKGFALVATHYTIMAAIHTPATIQYDPRMIAVSVALAVTISVGTLSFAERLRAVRPADRPSSDRLAGLPNGALLRDALASRLAAARSCAVIAVRVERFDEMGHRLGRREAERLLVRAGLRLRAAVRPTDLAARL